MKKSLLAALVISSIAATHASAFGFGPSVDEEAGEVRSKMQTALFMYTKSISRESIDSNCNDIDKGDIYGLTKNLVKLYKVGAADNEALVAAYKDNQESFDVFSETFKEKFGWGHSKLNDRKIDEEGRLAFDYFYTGKYPVVKNHYGPYADKELKAIYPFVVDAAYSVKTICGSYKCLASGKEKDSSFPFAINPDLNAKPSVTGEIEGVNKTFDSALPTTGLYWKNVLHKAYFFSVDDLKAINGELDGATPGSAAGDLKETLTRVLECDAKGVDEVCNLDSVFALDAIKANPSFSAQYKVFTVLYNKIYDFGIVSETNKRAFKKNFATTTCMSKLQHLSSSRKEIEKISVFPALSAENGGK